LAEFEPSYETLDEEGQEGLERDPIELLRRYDRSGDGWDLCAVDILGEGVLSADSS
jgi:hypothetical protein